MVDSVTRRSKDLSASHITVMGDYFEVRRSLPCGPEQQNLIIAGDDGEDLIGHDIVTMADTGAMSVTDTGTKFPYTTHGSTINQYYEEHKDKFKQIAQLRDAPVAGTAAISEDVSLKLVRQKAAKKPLHEGIHQTLLQLVAKARNSILKSEILVAQKPLSLVEAEPNEWQAYNVIFDKAGTTTQTHQIHSQLAHIQSEIAQLSVFQSVLEGHRNTIEGIENKAKQKSARAIANDEALSTFHKKVLPIQQNDKTIYESIKRQASLDEEGRQAALQLEADTKEAEDNPVLDANEKKAEIGVVIQLGMRKYNERAKQKSHIVKDQYTAQEAVDKMGKCNLHKPTDLEFGANTLLECAKDSDRRKQYKEALKTHIDSWKGYKRMQCNVHVMLDHYTVSNGCLEATKDLDKHCWFYSQDALMVEMEAFAKQLATAVGRYNASTTPSSRKPATERYDHRLEGAVRARPPGERTGDARFTAPADSVQSLPGTDGTDQEGSEGKDRGRQSGREKGW